MCVDKQTKLHHGLQGRLVGERARIYIAWGCCYVSYHEKEKVNVSIASGYSLERSRTSKKGNVFSYHFWLVGILVADSESATDANKGMRWGTGIKRPPNNSLFTASQVSSPGSAKQEVPQATPDTGNYSSFSTWLLILVRTV